VINTILDVTADRQSWLPSATTYSISAFGGDAVGHFWAVGSSGGIYEATGSSWNITIDQTLIWAPDAVHLYASDCRSSSTGGATWSAPPAVPCGYEAIWGSGPGDVYVVGTSGVITHFDGSSWTSTNHGTGTFRAVWGSGANDVYAVGDAGMAWHFDGASWQAAGLPATTDALTGVWGADVNHVFIVGENGRLLRRDPSGWTSSTIGGGITLHAVWGSAADNVWAVGDQGTILHFDGNAWTPIGTPSTLALYAIGGSSADDVFAAGDVGVILHYRGGPSWDPVRAPTQGRITGIWADPRRVYFGGVGLVLDRWAMPAGACAATEQSCNDGIDDDCDFLVDCNDPDCKGKPGCP
jgi:hypothetical protein